MILSAWSERIGISPAYGDQLQVVIKTDACLIPVLSVRGAHLQVVEYREVTARKWLFGDPPRERHARKEPPAFVRLEAGAAIVAERGIQHVFVAEGITQAGEERADRPLLAAAAGPHVAGRAKIQSPHVLVREVRSAGLKPVHVVVLVRHAAHELERVPVGKRSAELGIPDVIPV